MRKSIFSVLCVAIACSLASCGGGTSCYKVYPINNSERIICPCDYTSYDSYSKAIDKYKNESMGVYTVEPVYFSSDKNPCKNVAPMEPGVTSSSSSTYTSSESRAAADEAAATYQTTPSEEKDRPENVQAVEPADTNPREVEAVQEADGYEDLIGEWKGRLGDKYFVLNIEQIVNDKVVGWNKVGNNKRPVQGTLVPSTESGSSVKYELMLREPGTDKWDGEFDLIVVSPMANAAPTHCSGIWKSYKGGLQKEVEVDKKMY